MFLSQHKGMFIFVLVLFSLVLGMNTWLFGSMLGFLISGSFDTKEIPVVVWFMGVFALASIYSVGAYVVWIVKYRYFFKLHKLLKARMAGATLITVKLKGSEYEIAFEKGEYRIAQLNIETHSTEALVVLGSDYFDETDKQASYISGSPAAVRYLGPMRNLSDAKTFKYWFVTLYAARTVDRCNLPNPITRRNETKEKGAPS
ncbi:hypothetical protein KI440_02450 [Candidatus Saccharibacteria bacterium TM7i]|nr:hypothetical protein KI440_02450 [Candidatus Saccharibacteria bacterium TM7i]